MLGAEELHRVFVGGLFESITKDELSGKFKSFGDITDVTIIQKKDGDTVSKTFGYVNLKTTTQKLNKCFALFGGTKWKGHELKVQLAKEDFMARLERERNEPVVEKKSKKRRSGPQKTYDDILEVTSHMKKAVPGTVLEGEKNWVVGKYGRPLPVVYIPKFGNRKIIKVDPSKYCHCLKRIPDEGNDDVNIEELTWSYDSENKLKCKNKKRKRNSTSENEKRNGNADSVVHNVETIDISEDIDPSLRKKKKKRKKELKESGSCSTEETVSADIPSTDTHKPKEKNCKDENLGDITQRKLIKKNVENSEEFLKPPVDYVLDDLKDKLEENNNTEKILSASIVQQLLLGKGKCKKVSTNDSVRQSESDKIDEKRRYKEEAKGSVELTENVENLFDFEFKDIGDKRQSFLDNLQKNIELRENANEDESFSNDEDLVNSENRKESSDKEDLVSDNGYETKEVSTKNDEKCLNKNLDSFVVEKSSKKKERNKIPGGNKQQKHALSEEQRKKALETRDSQITKKKEFISQSLKDVDKSSPGNHIVFSGSDSESELSEKVQKDNENKIKKASLWSDSSDSEETNYAKSNILFDDRCNEQSGDDEEIKVKPQFQGKEGEKLFKLQQSFRGDERFRLDERFAENDIEDDVTPCNDINDDIANGLDSTECDMDLQKEKEMNLSVLEQVLGKSIRAGKKESDRVHQRYDPKNADHEKFELKTSKSLDEDAKEEEKGVEKVEVQKLPEVSKDKFYSVNESLKDLFGKKEEASAFSFLGQFNQSESPSDQNASEGLGVNNLEKSNNEEMKTGDSNKSVVKEPSWKKGLEMVANGEKSEWIHSLDDDSLHTKKRRCSCLYLADEDDRLEIGKSFIRTSEMEEISNQWKGMRRSLTEDYKKKHKDALRRVRKIRERRFFTR